MKSKTSSFNTTIFKKESYTSLADLDRIPVLSDRGSAAQYLALCK